MRYSHTEKGQIEIVVLRNSQAMVNAVRDLGESVLIHALNCTDNDGDLLLAHKFTRSVLTKMLKRRVREGLIARATKTK